MQQSFYKITMLYQSVANRDIVTIPKFGKFVTLEVDSRTYLNPSNPTGPKVHKPPTTFVKFRPFKHFKECVAEGKVR